jgi:predicted transcriptional regulator
MSRQLNLRVSDDFARKLERVARSTGQPMAAVLEAVGTPALDDVEADALFEAEALAAWESHQLTGESVGAKALDGQFAGAMVRARAPVPAPTKRRGK